MQSQYEGKQSSRGVLRNFTKFTGKHVCQSLFFNKVAGLGPPTLLKKKLWHIRVPVNFVKFLRTPFYTEYLWWLLLYEVSSFSISAAFLFPQIGKISCFNALLSLL